MKTDTKKKGLFRTTHETVWGLRLLLIVSPIFLCGIVLTSHSIYQRQKESLKSSVQNQMLAVAELKAGQVDTWLGERRDDARTAATGSMVALEVEKWQATGQADAPQKKPVERRLDRIRQFGNYDNVLVFGMNGKLLAAAREEAESFDLSGKDLVPQVIKDNEPIFSPLHREKAPNNPIFVDLLAPLTAEDEQSSRVVGVMLFRINPEKFLFPLIQSWPTPSPTAETLLVTREGNEVVYLNELRRRKNTALNLRAPLNEEHLPAAMAARGVTGVVEGIDYRDVPVLAAIKPVAGSPWIIVSKSINRKYTRPCANT